MAGLTMKFFNEIDPILQPYIRHYWMTSGELESEVKTTLLPMDHMDLIIPISGKFNYVLDDIVSNDDGIVFHGMRKRSVVIKQDKTVVAYGITFEPWGFYPFINRSLNKYVDKIIPLLNQDKEFAVSIAQCFRENNEEALSIKSLEEILIEKLNLDLQYEKGRLVIKAFIEGDYSTIKSFCEVFEIDRKQLERLFSRYVGVSPKEFMKIKQFEEAARNVMYNENSFLTDIAYEENYYDQAQFSKDFKHYTDYSPSAFKKVKPALKSKFKFK